MSTLYSIGQMNQLGDALEEAGYTPDEVTKLKPHLEKVKQLLNGVAEITVIPHVIDCDTDPYIPKGWEVIEHKKGGQWQFDPTKIEFYLSKEQQKGKSIEGNELRKELEGKAVMNANVLDYLLKHPEITPDEWKKDTNGNTRYIFFWGTIYRSSFSRLYVRYLCWDDGQWYWRSRWLDFDFDDDDPAAVFAGSK